jgi:hypothetical protein
MPGLETRQFQRANSISGIAPQLLTAAVSLTGRRIRYYVAFTIEHEFTWSCFDGSPWPPNGEGWVLVRVLAGGPALWRRISACEAKAKQRED